MARTLAQLERAMTAKVEGYVAGATTAGGAADGSTFVSSDLLKWPGQNFPLWYGEITEGALLGQVRMIKAATVTGTAPSHTVTVTPFNAFTAQVASGIDFRMHRVDPAVKVEAINDALESMMGIAPRELVDDFLTGELLRNHGFEFWRGNVPYDWENVAGSISPVTANRWAGEFAAELAASSTYRQRIALERDLMNISLTLTGRVRTTAGSNARLQIDVGGTIASSSFHSGGAAFEELSVTASVPDTEPPRYIYVRINTAVATVAQFDELHLVVADGVGTYVIPLSEAFRSIRRVQVRPRLSIADAAAPRTADIAMRPFLGDLPPPPVQIGRYGRYPYRFAVDQPVRVVGTGVWGTLAASTDSIDILEEDEQLFALRAGVILARRMHNYEFRGDRNYWLAVGTQLQSELAELPKKTKGFVLPRSRRV